MAERPDQGGVISATDKYGDEIEAWARDEQRAESAEIIASRDRAILDLNDVVASKASEIVALKKAFEDHMKTHEVVDPPVPDTCEIGTSNPGNTTGITAPIDAIRVYLQPGDEPTAVSQDDQTRRADQWAGPEDLIWLSIKEKAGPWLESLVDDFQSKRPKGRLILTADHEPYNNWFVKGDAGIATYHARQQALEDLLLGRPGVELVQVLEGWHIPARTPGYYDKMWRPKQGAGFDSYNDGNIGVPGSYRPPAVSHKGVLDYARSKGKVPYIGETGTGPVPGNAAGRLQWVKDSRAFWLGKDETTGKPRAQVVCMFNKDACQLTTVEMKAWLGR